MHSRQEGFFLQDNHKNQIENDNEIAISAYFVTESVQKCDRTSYAWKVPQIAHMQFFFATHSLEIAHRATYIHWLWQQQ